MSFWHYLNLENGHGGDSRPSLPRAKPNGPSSRAKLDSLFVAGGKLKPTLLPSIIALL
jgi:hypothetical protein